MITIGRFFILLWVMMILPVSANNLLQARPSANLFDGTNGVKTYQSDFLPADQAFQLEKKKIDNQGIHLQFIIADGYYLYKNQFAFRSDNPNIGISMPNLPKAEIKHDEFFGDVPVYHTVLDVVLPIHNPDQLAFNFEVDYQGCAEKGLCYPLETARIHVDGVKSDISTFETSKTLSLRDSIASLSFKTLLYYFGFGLLLSLTPCVFPMLPILAGIVLRGEMGTFRAQFLAIVYILSMAITYAILGVLVGLLGAELGLQAKLQSPWVLIPFALFFIVFAIAMFGMFELKVPTFITNSLNKASNNTQGGSIWGAIILGICSSLVVSPCVSAPFAGILLHISTTGDAYGGGISLFILGLGMGLPLFVIAAGGKAFLPKAGAWMLVARNAIGFMLLAVAIFLLSRILPASMTMCLWGLFVLVMGIVLIRKSHTLISGKKIIGYIISVLLIIYSGALFVGSFLGHVDPVNPFKESHELPWKVVTDQKALDQLLQQAIKDKKIALVDWSASWCVACVKMDHDVFADKKVAKKLADYALVRVDLSKRTPELQQLQNSYKVFGPPTILFFNLAGEELSDQRIVGEMGKADFLKYLTDIETLRSLKK